jgi:hypothetical protein
MYTKSEYANNIFLLGVTKKVKFNAGNKNRKTTNNG